MSTKIYDAYLTRRPMTHVMDRVKAMQKSLVMKADRDAARLMENIHKGNRDGFVKSLCRSIVYGMVDMYNPTASVVVYAPPQVGALLPQHLIVQVFGLRRSDNNILNRFVKTIDGEDFHYQDQSDRPDDVSDGEWAFRSKVWNRVLVGSGIPSECGLSYDLITDVKAVELLYLHYLRAAGHPDPKWSSYFHAQEVVGALKARRYHMDRVSYEDGGGI